MSALLDAEVNAKVTVATEAEIDAFIEANKAPLMGEAPNCERRSGRSSNGRRRPSTVRRSWTACARVGSVIVHLPPAPRARQERTKIASDLGLNMPAFNECVGGQAVAAAVREDETQARSLNLTSTPTFYINGRQLIGAQPLESFVTIIEDELSRLGKASTVSS